MTDEQIKHMVSRFLSWRLPEHFNPDAGISFTPEFNVEYSAKSGKPPQRHEPIGTNLFSADQAEEMVRHMLDGLTEDASMESQKERLKIAHSILQTGLNTTKSGQALNMIRILRTAIEQSLSILSNARAALGGPHD